MKSHKRIFGIAIFIAARVVEAVASDSDMEMREVPWVDVIETARTFVAHESPDGVWPFQRLSRKDRARSPRKVFVHYFPPYPISFDNKPSETDYWTTQYLTREGEGGKHADVGGFVRQRPLPTKLWDSPYWKEINAAIDVLRAQAMGADGFGVDIVSFDGQYWDQARRICGAATALHAQFYFVPEIDAAILAKATTDQIVDATLALNSCPASYHLSDGRILFIPFAPNDESTDYWEEVISKLQARGVYIAFVPDLLGLEQNASLFAPISAGLTFWGHKDILQATSPETIEAERRASSLVSFWMHPIAIQDARPAPAVYWEARNSELLRALWDQARQNKSLFAHLITWNDYGEGTEFSPSSGAQFAFYDLTAYYIDAFKSGRLPAVRRDAIYYSHRIELFDPNRVARSGDKPFRNLGLAPVSNEVEMVGMLRAPALLQISQRGRIVTAKVNAGLQVLHAPAEVGRPIFSVIRDGRTTVRTVSAWSIVNEADKATPDYFGGSSTRVPR